MQAGYKPGDDVFIALDVASSELWNDDGEELRVQEIEETRRAPPTRWSRSTRTGCGSIRSSRSRTASRKATGTAGRR